VLERNARLNPRKTNIMALMFAAMRANGFCEFQYGEPGYCNGGFHEGMSKWQHGSAFKLRVEGKNLQDFLVHGHPDLIPRLRFIKVDTEGFDLAILETLEDLIRRQRPYLQVELFSLRKSAPAYRLKLYDWLVGHGYDVHRIEGQANLLGDLITPDNLMRWNVCDVFCVPKGTGAHPALEPGGTRVNSEPVGFPLLAPGQPGERLLGARAVPLAVVVGYPIPTPSRARARLTCAELP
jgi:FkbM family methyltransferase